jgi:hypothetical protein
MHLMLLQLTTTHSWMLSLCIPLTWSLHEDALVSPSATTYVMGNISSFESFPMSHNNWPPTFPLRWQASKHTTDLQPYLKPFLHASKLIYNLWKQDPSIFTYALLLRFDLIMASQYFLTWRYCHRQYVGDMLLDITIHHGGVVQHNLGLQYVGGLTDEIKNYVVDSFRRGKLRTLLGILGMWMT